LRDRLQAGRLELRRDRVTASPDCEGRKSFAGGAGSAASVAGKIKRPQVAHLSSEVWRWTSASNPVGKVI